MKLREIPATLITILAITVGIGSPFAYERVRLARAGEGADRVITLTGVAYTGTWTTDNVTSLNYGHRQFEAAQLVLKLGETVVFRFKSADGTHSFYAPELGIGPIEVYPGKVVTVRFTADKVGRFQYLCTVACGSCHFWMQGVITVVDPDDASPPALDDEEAHASLHCPHKITLSDEGIDLGLRGHVLFETVGCITCHNREGRGGIKNLGYVKDSVPTLKTIAERMMLFDKEDTDAIIDLLERRIPLASVADDPPVFRFNAVLAQYDSICETIKLGSKAGKATPESPEPPYHMPRWADRLSDEDIDAILVYLLKQYPWDEEEEEEDEE